MLNLSFEFRKGIFFIRLIGALNKDTYVENEKELSSLIIDNKFKYIVINTNYLKEIDLDGLNYINKISCMIEESKGNLVICDKFKIIKALINSNIPSIEDELEVL